MEQEGKGERYQIIIIHFKAQLVKGWCYIGGLGSSLSIALTNNSNY